MTYAKTPATAVIPLLCIWLAACGGGSHTTSSSTPKPSSKSQAIVVSGGPDNNYANGLFTSVTICAPGTSNCQTVDNVLVDTGSYGLRLLSSALGTLSNSLPQQKGGSGQPLFECAQFIDSVLWGPVKLADFQIAGQKAASIPVEVIDAGTVPVASACKTIGPAEEDVSSLGANGILGIGFFVADCGDACAASTSSNPGFYYSCSGSSCVITSQPSNAQVQNPIAALPANNNGVVIELSSTSSSVPTLSGSLVLGIGSTSDNALGSAQIIVPDQNGNLKTTFNGKQYSGFLDTGSNAYFFLDGTTTGIQECSGSNHGFYCPSSPVSLSAVNASVQGSTTNTVKFTITSASQLFATNNFVFPSLGGPNPDTFDWGLPFFIGRKVFIALEGHSTPSAAGPFWAY